MESIYIIHGSTGEYSDRNEWVVCAFRKLEDAQSFILNIETKKREFTNEFGSNEWEGREQITNAMSQYDEQFAMDYTDTYYYMSTTELK